MIRYLAILAVTAASASGAKIPEMERQLQTDIFRRYWDAEFVWHLDNLPSAGTVPEKRVPYSGYIYPDTAGGTANALQKYDRAFHPGRYPAAAHERWDTTAHTKTQYRYVTRRVGGLFRGRTVQTRVAYTGIPHWHGHCNGWAAATMRHAEPKKQVERNGVVFSPADIKALLAEIYIYNETENLTGYASDVNAGTFHAIISNWIGRASHPVGMEADPGQEKWNYPIYAYKTSSGRISPYQVEVKMEISFAKDSRGEFQASPRISNSKYFHYVLDLNANGEIVGGQFYRDSSMIDLVWVPLRPKQGGEAGNQRGNPHVDVDRVLAIWRDSVPANVRREWPVVDPPAEDRLANFGRLATGGRLMPVQDVSVAVGDPVVTPVAAISADDSTVVAPAAEEHGAAGATAVELGLSSVASAVGPAERAWAGNWGATASRPNVSSSVTGRRFFRTRRSR